MDVKNLNEAFGSIVSDIDLVNGLDMNTRNALRKLFDTRGALVFRGLDIDFATQDRLIRALCGDDEPDGGMRDPMYVSNSEPGGAAPYGSLLFHADMMWHAKPFEVLSLYGEKIDPGSATTSLTSGVVAWERLPTDLKARCETLQANNVSGTVFSRGGPDLLRSDRVEEIATTKPLKIIHPRTGKPVLYVSQQSTRTIVGMEPEESEAFLQSLFKYLYDPSLVYEHTWEKGDLLAFDNVAIQHARSNVVLDGPKRTLRKVIAPVPKVEMEKPTFEKTRERQASM